MNQIDAVLQAVKWGCRTSQEISDVTKIPIKHCSAYLSTLERRGKIERTGRVCFYNREGDRHTHYAVQWKVSVAA
jgi:hypothetical protein